MPEFSPEIANDILAACQAGAGEAAEALGRVFDTTVTVTVGEGANYDPESAPSGFDGSGLIVALEVGTQAALVAIPEAGGLLPEWYANPDATGESRLSTLAQELGMLLLPESLMSESFRAGRVEQLSGAMASAGIVAGAGLVSLELVAEGDRHATASLIWPAASMAAAFGETADEAAGSSPAGDASPEPNEEETPDVEADTQQAPAAAAPPPPTEIPSPRPTPAESRAISSAPPTLESLPPYIRSVLQIEVPVMVTLASKKQPIGKVLELGPGSIIQFEKSCEELLDLEVGGSKCAQGEAVKVGDKFGIRLTSLVLPGERFLPIRPKADSQQAG